ncbi:MAG: type II CAAX prenyl endopeptidase Rce1 family protein, partial [Bacteroidota bacterium]
GLGEELFFRAALQPYLGIWITSVLFVAIHGYLNPWNWRMSLYGLMILPFIFLLSFGYEHFGLWFAVAAHFAYNAVLFTAMVRENQSSMPTR